MITSGFSRASSARTKAIGVRVLEARQRRSRSTSRPRPRASASASAPIGAVSPASIRNDRRRSARGPWRDRGSRQPASKRPAAGIAVRLGGSRHAGGVRDAALDEIEQRRDVFRPALLERRHEYRADQRRAPSRRRRAGIVHRVARHNGKRKILAPRRAGKFLDAIAPIVETAEQTDQHEARLACGLFDIEIDRIGMFERGRDWRAAGSWRRPGAVARRPRRG